MARLPDPITKEIILDWDEEYQVKSKQFFRLIGAAVRNAEREALKKAEPQNKGDDKDES